MKRALAWLAALLLSALPAAAGRLDGAVVERLPNGLTVLLLEDHTLPIVSVQMLYKAGGRNEQTGATGLAHFVEHMAYRATARFPDTDVVSRIYAVGGEWHGYTWIDQTTYFETVPKEHLPLVLDIEADRMARLLLPEKELEAERGAVLTELHGYENDPSSVLPGARGVGPGLSGLPPDPGPPHRLDRRELPAGWRSRRCPPRYPPLRS